MLAADFVLNQELTRAVLYPTFIWIILMDFVLRSPGNAMGDHRIKWWGGGALRLSWT